MTRSATFRALAAATAAAGLAGAVTATAAPDKPPQSVVVTNAPEAPVPAAIVGTPAVAVAGTPRVALARVPFQQEYDLRAESGFVCAEVSVPPGMRVVLERFTFRGSVGENVFLRIRKGSGPPRFIDRTRIEAPAGVPAGSVDTLAVAGRGVAPGGAEWSVDVCTSTNEEVDIDGLLMGYAEPVAP